MEKAPAVHDEDVDELEQMLRTKIDLKTGYAEPFTLSRAMLQTLRTLDLSDDAVFDKVSFRTCMAKLNCGSNKAAVDALFARYDRTDCGRVPIADFAEALFGIKPCPKSNMECRDVIKRIRDQLLARGESGYRGLVRALRKLDNEGQRLLTRAELTHGLESYGIHLSARELDTAMHFFDKDGRGRVSVTEFIVGLRPTMSPARLSLAKLAYMRLDKNPDGQVTARDLEANYLAARNPAVLAGDKTAAQVQQEFHSAWDGIRPDAVVSEHEFVEYYKDVSASIDNDAYFELLVRNSWRGSVKRGGDTESSARRVIVTHLDGSTTVESIDERGVALTDTAALTATLRKQGVTDILKVEAAL